MAFPWAAVAFGGLQAASGILSTAGRQQQSRAQTRARNRSLLSSYNYNLQRYNAEVANQRRVYDARVQQFQQQVKFNNQELQFAYQEEQMRLNDLFDQTMVDNQNSLINFAKVDGSYRATGQSGKSVERLEQSNMAALGRLQATRAASLSRAIDQKKFNDKRNRLRIDNANQRAYAEVSVAPTFAPPPLFPGQQDYESGFGLSYAGNILSGIQTGLSMSGVNPFVKPPNE